MKSISILLNLVLSTISNITGQIVLNVNSVNPDCAKAFGHNYSVISNGSINVIPSGGTAPYSFELVYPNLSHKLQNNGYFPGLDAGTYGILVTDANLLTATQIIVLTYKNPVPQVYLYGIASNPASCTSIDGSMFISGTGGTPPYTFSVDGGLSFNSADTFRNLRQGDYIGMLMDANGCLAVKIPGNGLSAQQQDCGFQASISMLGITACSNDATVTVYASHSTLPFHDTDPWLFSYDGVNFHKPALSASEDTVGNIGPGIHDFYVKDTTTGVIAIASYNIVKSCFIHISFVGIAASCKQSDGSITVTVKNGVPPYTYTIDGVNYQSDNVFSGLGAGNYSVTVKDANGDINSASAVVYDKCPVLQISQTDELCGLKNGTILARGSNGSKPYEFSINNGSFQTDGNFQNLSAGFYKVILKDANNFTDSAFVTIINNCLKVTVTANNETCGSKNGIIIANATGGSQPYNYSIDGVNFQPGNSFAGLAKGQYTITVKDAAGATSAVIDSISNTAGPAISISSTNADCFGNAGIITVSTIGGTAPFQYSLDSSIYQASNVFSNINQGLYKVTIKDATGCATSDTINVSRNPTLVVSIGNDTSVCVGQTVLLKAPAGSQYKYQWQDNSTASNYTVNSTGQYWLKVTNQFNCAAADTINIVIKPLPVFSLGNDTSICTGRSLNLAVTLTGASYLWSTGSTSPSLSINSTGLYWLKVSDGCTKTDSIVVSYRPSPIVNLGRDSTLCEGQTLQLNAGNLGTTYIWQDNSTAADFQVSKEGIYFVNVNKSGCVVADTIDVTYKLKPRFTLGPDQLICQGHVITLQPSNNENWQLRWQDGSNKSSIQITQPGLYGLTATNTCGSSRDEVQFTKGLCKVYVPNAFSPNGDTRNDVFKVSGTDMLTEFHLQIFNRYGQLIFETTDKNKGWDGSFNNKPAVNGNYVYLLQYKESGSAEIRLIRGNCLLIR